jgi:hypothetical protein
MQLFKHKKKSYTQKDNFSHPTTIDDKHQLKVREVEEAYKNIPQYEESLNQMKRRFKELSKKKSKELTSEELEEKLHFAERISDLEKEIDAIRNKYMNREYELNTCHTLYFYYEDPNLSANTATTKATTESKPVEVVKTAKKTVEKRGPLIKRNILDFLSIGGSKNEETQTSGDNVPTTVTLSDTNKVDISINHNTEAPSDSSIYNNHIVSTKSKTELMEEYLSFVDPNYIKKDVTSPYTDLCHICKEHRIYDLIHSTLVCPNCGTEEKILIDSEIPSYKEPPREVTYFAYKRINHFNEWLSQLQAKESTNIDRSVFDKIYSELDKEKYIDRSTIDTKKVLEILKKLNMPKYYEHCSYIANHISGRPPLVIDPDTEEKARNMFKEIQGPWMKYCKPGRSNFFSYPYILYKFFQLLEKDHYLPMLRLLKTREKLQEQDDIWKKICEDLRWEFIRTV